MKETKVDCREHGFVEGNNVELKGTRLNCREAAAAPLHGLVLTKLKNAPKLHVF